MKTQILSFVILFSSIVASGQKTIDVDKANVNPLQPGLLMIAGGEPLGNVKYTKVVAGSAYFSDDWMKAEITGSDGSHYRNVLLRVDLLDNSIQYLGKDGTPMIAAVSAKSIRFIDTLMNKEYIFDYSSYTPGMEKAIHGWYQWQVGGHATLYTKLTKNIDEDRPYGSATVEQTIRNTTTYYILKDGIFAQVKKFSELPDALSDKKTELAAYIKAQHLSGKTADDYTNVVIYYNSLFQ